MAELRGLVTGQRTVASVQRANERCVRVVRKTLDQQRADFVRSLDEVGGRLRQEVAPLVQQQKQLGADVGKLSAEFTEQQRQLQDEQRRLGARVESVFQVAQAVVVVLGLVVAVVTVFSSSPRPVSAPVSALLQVVLTLTVLIAAGTAVVTCVVWLRRLLTPQSSAPPPQPGN